MSGLAGIGASVMLKMSPVGRLLKAIPRPVWIALGAALLLLLGFWWHGRQVKAFGAERFAAGYAKAVEDGKKRVRKVEQNSAKITTEIRSKSDEEIRRNSHRADDLRLRGPGAAACVNPGLPTGSGGHGEAGGQADAAGAGVPQQDRIALPFAYAVDQAEVADANRVEVLAWREWHARLTEEWKKYEAASK